MTTSQNRGTAAPSAPTAESADAVARRCDVPRVGTCPPLSNEERRPVVDDGRRTAQASRAAGPWPPEPVRPHSVQAWALARCRWREEPDPTRDRALAEILCLGEGLRLHAA